MTPARRRALQVRLCSALWLLTVLLLLLLLLPLLLLLLLLLLVFLLSQQCGLFTKLFPFLSLYETTEILEVVNSILCSSVLYELRG